MSLWTAAQAVAATGGSTQGDWFADGVSIDSRSLQRGICLSLCRQRGMGMILSRRPLRMAPPRPWSHGAQKAFPLMHLCLWCQTFSRRLRHWAA